MKRIACILLTITTLAAQFVNAQTCPGSATYTNQSGTFDLTSGKTIILNGGKSYQITITNDFSSTSSICVLNGSTLNLSFQNVNNIQKGGFINVDKNANLIISSNITNFPLTITNNGTTTQQGSITYGDGATITNSGTYNISGSVTLNTGTVSIANTGAFTVSSFSSYNSGNFSLTNSATGAMTFNGAVTFSSFNITNSGIIKVGGAVTLQNSSIVTNNGYMDMSSDLNFSSATFNNNGVDSIAGNVMINSGNTLTNTCTVKILGAFSSNGTVNNSGKILISGSFINQNSFTNGTNGFVQMAGSFSNNGNISGSGNFYCSGSSTNQGPFNGTSSTNKINFYEPSLTASNKYFDVQNTIPTNITKNPILPNTSTSFTSCSDVSAPLITTQPQKQMLCSSSVTSATFSVTATSNNAPTYQWYKNGAAVSGATASSYTALSLTLADTASAFTVGVTNSVGTTTSSSASVKYIIVAQPAPVTQYLATGNAASFSIKTSGATAWQWQKNNSNISGATASSYALSVTNYADSGNYTALVSYNGGTCTSNAAVLKTSIVLYSKSTGNLNLPLTWGVATDGSGSSPVDFTRDEHTFIVANRSTAATGSNLTIAGTLDVANGAVTLTPGTTLSAGRIIRSLSTGVIVSSSSSNLTLNGISTVAYSGNSDLYFDAVNDTIKNVTIAAQTVTLHTALNLTAGATPGVLQVNSGTFNTSDSLTLKSDINGTASIAKSAGAISGKVTIEKFIHARRAYRLLGAPVTSTNAPSINAAWQEGAASSTDNPHPGYGTHVTYGLVSDGFDQNPQKTFSMRVYNSTTASWAGVPPTKTTAITSYPAYLIFIRGNRSYNITTTTNSTTPMTTILRVTGNVNQGALAAKTVAATGLTLMLNPYASPVDFSKIVSLSSNVKARYHVWDPSLAGTNGTGAWVTVDGSSGTYRATPPSAYTANVLEAGQGFFAESNDGINAGSLSFTEDVKDPTVSTTSADRTGDDVAADTSLEINLKVFNPDSTTSIADGVLFNFNAAYSDSVDNNDAVKLGNISENLGIKEGNALLTIDDRTMPEKGDSLHLSLTKTKSASYQFEIVPSALNNQSFALYDKYLNTFSPISSADTTRITFMVNNAVAASKAADRFTIVVLASKITNTVLPVLFTDVKAYAKEKAITVEWKVADETGVLYYEVEKSANGIRFIAGGKVTATGASLYSFTDAAAAAGINYYRVKSVGKNGEVLYSGIVKAQLPTASAGGASSVSVYPNPLTGTRFTLTLANLAEGAYTVSVMDQNGALQLSKAITHSGGTASQIINLNNRLAAGIYYIKIASATNTATNTVKVVAQ